MKYESFLLLSKKVQECPQIVTDPSVFARELRAQMEPVDEDGYMELIALSGEPELLEVVRPERGASLTAAQREQNMRTARALLARIREDGAQPYASVWGVNCWMNALAWPFCLIDGEYIRQTQQMETQELEELVRFDEDGYAASALALRAEREGDTETAAQWLAAAFDCCEVTCMRRMEHAAAHSGVKPQILRTLTQRHAALGDAQGLAEYALCLLETGEDVRQAKRLAMLSADMGCAAGHYALYLCLGDALDGGEVPLEQEDAVIAEMARLLTLAADGGDPRALKELEEAATLTEEEPAAGEPEAEEEPDMEAEEPEAEEEPEAQEEDAPDCAFPALWRCISGVLGAADDVMIEATGDPMEDDTLIDLMLACLCGAMRAYDTPAQALAAKEALISQFGMLMPDFADSGFDEAALRSAFDRVAGLLEEIRPVIKREYLKKDADAQLDWSETCVCEAVTIGTLFRDVWGHSEQSLSKMQAALADMMFHLSAALDDEEE